MERAETHIWETTQPERTGVVCSRNVGKGREVYYGTSKIKRHTLVLNKELLSASTYFRESC